jgi:hypothetical protein
MDFGEKADPSMNSTSLGTEIDCNDEFAKHISSIRFSFESVRNLNLLSPPGS